MTHLHNGGSDPMKVMIVQPHVATVDIVLAVRVEPRADYDQLRLELVQRRQDLRAPRATPRVRPRAGARDALCVRVGWGGVGGCE